MSFDKKSQGQLHEKALLDIAVEAKNLTKVYKLNSNPHARLLEILFPKFSEKIKNIIGDKSIEIPVIDNLSFCIQRGDSIGIIGLNGAGKSTLLQLISGIIEPTSGTVKVNGRIAALLELGAGFNMEFTGRENIYFVSKAHNFTDEEIKRKVGLIIEFSDIGNFIDQPVKKYSTGMYVRLAFAIAIHSEPDVLIIDEALSVGDIRFQQKCFRFMETQLPKTTRIFVSHDLSSIAALCRYTYFIDSGKILSHGATKDVISHYLTHARKITERNSPENICASPNVENFSLGESIPIPKSSQSNTDIVIFNSFKLSLDEVLILHRSIACDYGQKLFLQISITSARDINEAIFGYILEDAQGLYLTGDNTQLNSEVPQLSLQKGDTVLSFSFEVPLIESREYTLTIGIGEGQDGNKHTVLNWAYSILNLTISSSSPILGIKSRNPFASFNSSKS